MAVVAMGVEQVAAMAAVAMEAALVAKGSRRFRRSRHNEAP